LVDYLRGEHCIAYSVFVNIVCWSDEGEEY